LRRLSLFASVLIALAGCASTATRPVQPVAAPVSAEPSSARTVEPTVSSSAVTLGDYHSGQEPAKLLWAAMSAAAKDHHNVLVAFGTDGCPGCRALAELSVDPQVAPLLAYYHVVNIDIGQFDRNLDIATQLFVDLRTSGSPALVVIAPNGHIKVATNDGSFSNARTMTASQVAAFLDTWR
jgi:thiol-disulfide isomerase/thioredoxin